jgi:8-oxo-dGTP pyrophosphatase MutT (NUDIX family)
VPDFLIVIDVHLLLVRDDEVLLSKRRGNYGDGQWHLPAGKVEAGESAPAAAIREAHEEVGVRIAEEDLRFAHALHARGKDVAPRMGLFFEVRTWSGEPVNREPDKCYELKWFRWNNLPDNMISYSRAGIRGYLDGNQFGVLGW